LKEIDYRAHRTVSTLFHAGWIIALAVVLMGASCQTSGVKKAGYVGLSAAGQAIWLAQETEMGLVCERAGAPPAPACVPLEVHKHDISPRFAKANAIGEKASAALAALPPTITGTPSEILQFVSDIWALLTEIRTLIPVSAPQKELGQKLDALAARK
jgi:hypothetical protein